MLPQLLGEMMQDKLSLITSGDRNMAVRYSLDACCDLAGRSGLPLRECLCTDVIVASHQSMAIPGRLELPTYGLGNRRSIRLSYGTAAGDVSQPGWLCLLKL